MDSSDTSRLFGQDLSEVGGAPAINPTITATRIFEVLPTDSRFQLPSNHSISIRLHKGGEIKLYIGNGTELVIASKETIASRVGNQGRMIEVPYLIVAPGYREQFPHKGFKGLRKFERVILGRETKGYHADIADRLSLGIDGFISSVHLSVELSDDDVLTITDLHSTNGTFLNFSGGKVLESHPRKNIKQDFSPRNQDLINKDPVLASLWPNIHRGMEQGPVGNCYFVVAMNAIKTHSRGYELLKGMITKLPNGNYRVIFKGINSYTDISTADIAEMGKEKMQGSLGDQILERAYWRLRFHKTGTHFTTGFAFDETPEPGLNVMPPRGKTLKAITPTGYKVHEFGNSVDVFSDFFGDIVDTKKHSLQVIPGENKWPLLELLKDAHTQDYILTLSTVNLRNLFLHPIINQRALIKIAQEYFPIGSDLYNAQVSHGQDSGDILPEIVYDTLVTKIIRGEIRGDDTQKFIMSDIHGRPCGLYFGHAYSVGEVNLEEGFIEVINPHDTVNERFKFSIESVDRLFGYLSIIQVK